MFVYPVDKEIELKLMEQSDAKMMMHTVNANRDYLKRWLPWVENMKTAEDYYPVIKTWLQQFANNDGFQGGIFYQGSFVGMVGFHGLDWKNHSVIMGYWLAENVQGKGIMTRSVCSLVDHAFYEWQLNRVEIRAATENHPSRAIPDRLGFKHEGCLRGAEYLYDHYIDLEVYSMLKKDWLS